MASVFLSHCHVDKPFARKLAADLRRHGHAIWIDEAEINIGDSLIEKIRCGIDQVDFVAALLSPTSVASEWVRRELDIASNREIKNKKVLVLPILIEHVELPGFLEGKRYADFTTEDKYEDGLKAMLKALGNVSSPPEATAEEIETLKKELELARSAARQHSGAAERASQVLFRQKSNSLQTAILAANTKYPLYAPVNTAYAFEVGSMPITLDYVLWALAKSQVRGVPHQLEILIDLEDKWDEVNLMLEAYKEMLESMATASGEK